MRVFAQEPLFDSRDPALVAINEAAPVYQLRLSDAVSTSSELSAQLEAQSAATAALINRPVAGKTFVIGGLIVATCGVCGILVVMLLSAFAFSRRRKVEAAVIEEDAPFQEKPPTVGKIGDGPYHR